MWLFTVKRIFHLIPILFVTVLAFNFLGDGLRDAVDTKAAA
jgi:ABC-type dipeptide/oligopeptide/nickel transport system permease subunit